MIHYPTSEGVSKGSEGVSKGSERANEWAQRRAWAKWAVRSKRTSERGERTDEPVAQYFRLDSWWFWTIVQRLIHVWFYEIKKAFIELKCIQRQLYSERHKSKVFLIHQYSFFGPNLSQPFHILQNQYSYISDLTVKKYPVPWGLLNKVGTVYTCTNSDQIHTIQENR